MALPSYQVSAIFDLPLTIMNRIVLLYIVGFVERSKSVPDVTSIGVAVSMDEDAVLECLSDLVQAGHIESMGGEDYVLIPASYQPRRTVADALKSVLSHDLREVRPIDAMKGFEALYVKYRGRRMSKNKARNAYALFRGWSRKFSAKFLLHQTKGFFEEWQRNYSKFEPTLKDFGRYIERKHKSKPTALGEESHSL